MPQSQNHYQWGNKADYPNDGVQSLTEKLMPQQTEQEEMQHLLPLFDRLLSKSDFAMVHFNNQTKQVSLHHIPTQTFKTYVSSQSIGVIKEHTSITNFLVYRVSAARLFGGQGARATFRASRYYRHAEYGVEYGKTLWERVDNNISTNKDQISFIYSIPNLTARLSRESRGNYVDLLDKDRISEKIFGGTKQQGNILKQSNLLSLDLDFKHSFLNLQSKLGWDYGNKSLFLRSKLKLQTYFPLSKKFKLYMSVEGAQVDGQNILKNDLLLRNNKEWPGNRTSNFITPRIELIFAQYPYFSYLNIRPYFYAQLWANFNRKPITNRFTTKLEMDYGVGLTSNSNQRLDFSLFKISGEKEGRFAFGNIKFSF